MRQQGLSYRFNAHTMDFVKVVRNTTAYCYAWGLPKTPVDRVPCKDAVFHAFKKGLFWDYSNRYKRLQKECLRLRRRRRLSERIKDENFKNFVIEHQNKILWCPIAGAGSETWYYNTLLAMEVEPAVLAQENGPPSVKRQLIEPNRRQVLEAAFFRVQPPMFYPAAYNTILLVRHPFVRLIAAYKDFKANPRDYDFDVSVTNKGTFHNFVNVVIKLQKNYSSSYPFWAPMYDHCNVCQVEIKWTFILKYENLPHDPREDVLICLVSDGKCLVPVFILPSVRLIFLSFFKPYNNQFK